VLNGGGYESFPGLAVTFILLCSQFPSRFLVNLLLDRFLRSQIVSHNGKGGPNYFANGGFAGLIGFAIFIALFGLKSFNVDQFVKR
jgi:hypothetical protein